MSKIFRNFGSRPTKYSNYLITPSSLKEKKKNQSMTYVGHFFSNVFTPDEVENIKAYKYNGSDKSICVKLFLRKYWDYLITFFPMTIAPNMITLIGFLCEFITFLISFIVSNALRDPLPSWLCIINGISLHVYSTLDNLDGRQARRTGNSSALGQFFDHGCDAITGVTSLMKVAMTFSMGRGAEAFYFIFILGFCFYMTSWGEYITHAFVLGYINGPDEGLLILSSAQILAGIFPSIKPLVFNPIVKFLFCCGGVITCMPIIIDVVKYLKTEKNRIVTAIIAIIPGVISTVLIIMNSLSDVDPKQSPYFVIVSGLILCFQSQMLIVAHLSLRHPKKLFMPIVYSLWGFLLIPILISSINEGNLYWGLLTLIVFGMMIYYDLRTIYGLSRALGIPILTIKPKEETEKVEIVPEEIHIEEEEVPYKEVPMNIFQDANE